MAILLNLANQITLNQKMRTSHRKDSANTLELSFFQSINSSQILTACQILSPEKSFLHRPMNNSFAKSNHSGKSKYSNSSKLTKSNLYDTLRRGHIGNGFRREEQLDIQLNLLTESLHILNKQGNQHQSEMTECFEKFAENGKSIYTFLIHDCCKEQ